MRSSLAVLATLVTFLPTLASAEPANEGASCSAAISRRTVTVSSRNDEWTPTGLMAHPGDYVIAFVTGLIDRGDLRVKDGGGRYNGGLKIKIGYGFYDWTGAKYLLRSDVRPGEIKFRVHDSVYTDNSGAYDVDLIVIPGQTLPASGDLCIAGPAAAHSSTAYRPSYPTEPPPRPQYEDPAARAGYLWIRGHYEWARGSWYWKEGHWERAQAGKVWRHGRWERHDDRYVWVPGEWIETGEPAVTASKDPPEVPKRHERLPKSFAKYDVLDIGADTTLDPDGVVRRIASRYLSGIKRCHGRVLRKRPRAGGRVNIRITIGPSGSVTRAAVKGFDPTVDTCIESLTHRWRFGIPRDKSGKPVQADFAIPLILKPAG